MSLILFEGFEQYGLNRLDFMNTNGQFFFYSSSSLSSSYTHIAASRYNGLGVKIGQSQGYSSGYLNKTIPNQTSMIFGMAYMRGSSVNVSNHGPFVEFRDSAGGIQGGIGFDTNTHKLTIFTNVSPTTPTIRVTGSHFIYPSTWMYIEIKYIVDKFNGLIEIRLNGNLYSSWTGDTDPRSTGNISKPYIHYAYVNGTIHDDIYLLNTDGSNPWNDYLGPIRIDQVLPTSDGTYSEFNSTSTPSWDVVNSASISDTAGYLYTSDINKKSTFNKSSIGLDIIAFQSIVSSKTINYSNLYYTPIIRSSDNVILEGSDSVPYNDWTISYSIFTTSTDGVTPINTAIFNNLEIGVMSKEFTG
jgi:hypothetical protein